MNQPQRVLAARVGKRIEDTCYHDKYHGSAIDSNKAQAYASRSSQGNHSAKSDFGRFQSTFLRHTGLAEALFGVGSFDEVSYQTTQRK